MLFLSVTASAISWQYSLKISFNYLFFSSLRNIFNISYIASVITNSSVAMSQDYLFPLFLLIYTCLFVWSTFCLRPKPASSRHLVFGEGLVVTPPPCCHQGAWPRPAPGEAAWPRPGSWGRGSGEPGGPPDQAGAAGGLHWIRQTCPRLDEGGLWAQAST